MKTTNNKSTNATQNQNKLNKLASILVLGGLIFTSTVLSAAPKKPVKAEAPKLVSSTFNESLCLGGTGAPGKLVLPVGKSTLLQLPEAVSRRTVGNPNVLATKLFAPKTLYLLGTGLGTTNMIVQDTKGTCTVVDVIVSIDPEGLQQTLSQLLPDEKNIKVSAAEDSLILSGTVQDAVAADHAVQIANAFAARRAVQSSIEYEKSVNSQAPQNEQLLTPPQLTPDGTEKLSETPNTVINFGGASGGQRSSGQRGVSTRVINLLSVSAQQQVMLEVKVAEVSKTLLDQLGAQAIFGGTSKYGLITNFLSNSAGLIGKLRGNGIAIDAEKNDGLIKILAEPTIMAISGQEGSFLAGGTIFIPVAQNNNNGVATITLEEKEFGVGVRFTPTVLAGGRINLKVAPEVSELNRDGVALTAGGAGTAIFPSFTTRRASTTVQLFDGQTFAIGGLIKNNTTTNIKAFPILGEIPILGALFRSTDFQKDKTELIFLVTPHLVKPLAGNYRLPTDNYIDPSRTDLFLNGRMEGPAPASLPATPAPVKNQDMPAKNDDNGFELK